MNASTNTIVGALQMGSLSSRHRGDPRTDLSFEGAITDSGVRVVVLTVDESRREPVRFRRDLLGL